MANYSHFIVFAKLKAYNTEYNKKAQTQNNHKYSSSNNVLYYVCVFVFVSYKLYQVKSSTTWVLFYDKTEYNYIFNNSHTHIYTTL